MTGVWPDVVDDAAPANGQVVLRVGGDAGQVAVPCVRDAELDDAYAIDVAPDGGAIAGSNPRSVLLGVYRCLSELGCRWVRPGLLGERLPRLKGALPPVRLADAAAYRHRAVCIEGAVSEAHVVDMVEWLPRVGMNGYFVQFHDGYTFFERWYSHRQNPRLSTEPFDRDRASAIVARVASEAARRGLLYHAVGHGWTCEPFGLPGLGWEYGPVAAGPEIEPFLALVNGKRAIWEGIPLNTNLCYSNPEVRRRMVEDVCRYSAAHPEVSFLHVWLADGANNQCECEACARMRPADWYVLLLNEMDRELDRQGSSMRIVFLLYVDLLWPPEKERLTNPGRFVLMFAPITRSYTRSYPLHRASGDMKPYVRNRLEFPRSVEDNLAYLDAWRQWFDGDSFDFDYHYMWDHYNDPGGMQLARVLHEDIRRLKAMGLNGLVSCQTQRAFFPTGAGMAVLARTLWNPGVPFDAIVNDCLEASFGEGWSDVRAYLDDMSEMFDPPYLRGERPSADVDRGNVQCAPPVRFREVPARTAEARALAAEGSANPDPCVAASWRYLLHHADLCEKLARAYDARWRGDLAEAQRCWAQTAEILRDREPEVHPVLDVYLMISTLQSRFAPRNGLA